MFRTMLVIFIEFLQNIAFMINFELELESNINVCKLEQNLLITFLTILVFFK